MGVFKPNYRCSDRLLNDIAEIERQTIHLNQTAVPDELVEHIRKQCLVALTHYSTQIEGNKLTLEQVSGLIEEEKNYGFLRDEKEVKNYFRLLKNILMNSRQTRILEYLEKKGVITASQYARRFHISSRMASRDLRQLIEWRKLTAIGKARSTKYILKT